MRVYERGYDSRFPVVCMDESTKQQVQEIVEGLPLTAGQGHRYDHEYKRNGVSHLFMYYEPLGGYRHMEVKDAHTAREWVYTIKDLMEGQYKEAEKVTFVLDNLRTHNPEFFYQFLPPKEAGDMVKRLEFCYTPKHGSWLNMAEMEFSILQKQCLDRRIPDQERLKKEIAKWEEDRNKQGACTKWRFTTDKARIKLRKLYPSISP